MEEKKLIKREIMNQEEFEDYIHQGIKYLYLHSYEAVHKYKSVRRAIKRGHVTTEGYIIPKRPFNNGANRSKRRGVHSKKTNELKKIIYGRLKQYQQG